MPAPQPDRANFLLYLRSEFPYKMDFSTLKGKTVPYQDIYNGMLKLRTENPELYRIMWLHTHTRLPRDYMVDLTWFDTSTVKRRINQAAETIAAYSGFSLIDPETAANAPIPSRENVFARNHFLTYLGSGYRNGEDYVDLRGEVLPRTRISYGIERLRDNDPKFSRMIQYHINSPLPRTQIAKSANADPSTVKRRMSYAADLVMQRARHSPELDPLDGVPVIYGEPGKLRDIKVL